MIREILQGKIGPARDIAALNAGAAIHIAGQSFDVGEGTRIAQEAIDSKAALTVIRGFGAMLEWIGFAARFPSFLPIAGRCSGTEMST